MKRWILALIVLVVLAGAGFWVFNKVNVISDRKVGQVVDQFHGVKVYYNGGVTHVEGRNIAPNGYNLGLKYQCVEFVKRYYFEYLKHEMPDSYGHAKDFYDHKVKDGARNKKRNLVQYRHPSHYKPKVNDLVIMAGNLGNPYGHVAIVSKVSSTELEIIQQNPGPFGDSRALFSLALKDGSWHIGQERILGWLRKE